MLRLIDAHGHEVRLIEQDVARHEHGVGEQAAVDVVRMPGALVLELGHAAHLAHIGEAVEQPVHLRVLGDVALEEEHVFVGVKANGQQQREELDGLLAQLGRLLPHGDGVQVGDHVEAIVFILEQLPVAHRADIVAQCGGAGGLDAREDALTPHGRSLGQGLFHKKEPPFQEIAQKRCIVKEYGPIVAQSALRRKAAAGNAQKKAD